MDIADKSLAVNKVLLGQLHMIQGDEKTAIIELESSCPVLWLYDMTRDSSYIEVSDIYICYEIYYYIETILLINILILTWYT